MVSSALAAASLSLPTDFVSLLFTGIRCISGVVNTFPLAAFTSSVPSSAGLQSSSLKESELAQNVMSTFSPALSSSSVPSDNIRLITAVSVSSAAAVFSF